MRNSVITSLVVAVALASCGSGSDAGTQPDSVVLTVSGGVIESRDHGPMLTWTLLLSNPPQGGVIELANWDWDAVRGEESSQGTTWGSQYDLVGTWDGTEFTLTQPPTNVPDGAQRFEPGGSNCTDPDLSETVDYLRSLDRAELGLGSRGSRLIDGACSAFVEAYFDTPQLRAALEPVADAVQLDLYFRPLTQPDD